MVATIREIARLAQVSVGTVSKVLTNTPYVSEETRARVLKVIEEVGYKPSFAGRALSLGRTYNVGVIFPHRGADRFFSDPYQITILQEIERVMSEAEYNIILSAPAIPYADARQFQRLISGRYLDGAITFEILPVSALRPHLQGHNIPCISVGYHPETCDGNTVYVDDYVGAKALLEYCVSLGHRRIGFVTVSASTIATWAQRMNGYRDGAAATGLCFDELPQVEGDFTVESGRAAVDTLLQRAEGLPTVIVCFNDRMAIGAMQRLQSVGLRVPQDVSVVGFDDIQLATTIHPALTTVRQPSDLVGARAADLIIRLIEGNTELSDEKAVFEPVILPSELVLRDSLAPIERG